MVESEQFNLINGLVGSAHKAARGGEQVLVFLGLRGAAEERDGQQVRDFLPRDGKAGPAAKRIVNRIDLPEDQLLHRRGARPHRGEALAPRRGSIGDRAGGDAGGASGGAAVGSGFEQKDRVEERE